MPLFGNSLGVQVAQGVQSFDAGVDRAYEIAQANRKRKLDEEQLRALGVNTDNAVDQNERLENLHPHEIERLQRGNRGLQISNSRENIRLGSERDERGRELDNAGLLDTKARLTEQDAVGQLEGSIQTRPGTIRATEATNSNTIATQYRTAAEQSRLAVSDRATAPNRRATEELIQDRQKLDALRAQMEARGLLDKAADELSPQEKQRVNDTAAFAMSTNFAMFKQGDKAGAIADFNEDKIYGAEGAVDARIKDGKYEFLNANGEVLTDEDGNKASFDEGPLQRNYDARYDKNKPKAKDTKPKDFDPSKYDKELIQSVVLMRTGQTNFNGDLSTIEPENLPGIIQNLKLAKQLQRERPGMSYVEAATQAQLEVVKQPLRRLGFTSEQLDGTLYEQFKIQVAQPPAASVSPEQRKVQLLGASSEEEFYKMLYRLQTNGNGALPVEEE